MYLKLTILFIILIFTVTNSVAIEKIIDEKTKNLTAEEQIYFKGLVNTKNKNYVIALQLFQSLIEQNPNHLKAHYMKGLIMLYQNNLKDSEIEFLKVIELDENFYQAYAGLGKIQLEKRLFQDALNKFEKTLKLNPKYDEVYYDIGLAYLGLNNFDKAYDFFNITKFKLLDKNKCKDNIEAINSYCFDENIREFFQGFLLYKLGFYRLAQLKLKSFINVENKDVNKWNKLGRMYLSLCQVGTYYD
jgi:tetratricopeptide (TPR) repeat protein